VRASSTVAPVITCTGVPSASGVMYQGVAPLIASWLTSIPTPTRSLIPDSKRNWWMSIS
jgi:hypothetical protein